MPLRLYDYPPSANCYKVRLLLAQLGLDYERVPVDIFAGETLTEDYGQKNLGRTTPVLEIAPGQYLPESNAILLHLAEGTDFLPSDKFLRSEVHRWLFFEQAAILPMVAGPRFRLLTGRWDADSEQAKRAQRAGAGVIWALEAHLHDRDFFVGDTYTVADICLFGYMHVAHEAGIDMDPFAGVGAWLERVRSRPDHINDLEPYPDNARPEVSRSIHDILDR